MRAKIIKADHAKEYQEKLQQAEARRAEASKGNTTANVNAMRQWVRERKAQTRTADTNARQQWASLWAS